MSAAERRNLYPWNDAHSAANQTPEAFVLHLGLNAICEHLAAIERAIRQGRKP